MEKINLTLLKEMIAEKNVLVNKHKTLPISIYNYSKSCQFDMIWNEVTLIARGLVLDNNFNLIALPFPKFFNYEEHASDKLPKIPNEKFEIFEKMDGCLGIVFKYKNNLICATRGSFNSEQSIWMKNFFDKNKLSKHIKEDYTYLFEIIYPKNRIVVNYDNKEKIVLLGINDIKNLKELSYDKIKEDYSGIFEIVKRYDNLKGKSFSELQKLNLKNKEGFVLRYKSGFRVKVKFEDYCRLHAIMTRISSRDIWEYVAYDKDIDELLEKIPDEIFKWVDLEIKKFEKQYKEINSSFLEFYKKLISELNKDFTDKEFALKLNEIAPNSLFKSLAFLYKNEKFDIYNIKIFKSFYPKHLTPFMND